MSIEIERYLRSRRELWAEREREKREERRWLITGVVLGWVLGAVFVAVAALFW